MANQKVPDPAPEKWNRRVKQWHPVVPGSRFTKEMVTAVLPSRVDVRESIIKGEFVKDPNYQPIGNVAVATSPYIEEDPPNPYPRFYNPDGNELQTVVVQEAGDYHVAHAVADEVRITMLATTKGVVLTLSKGERAVSSRICKAGEEIETLFQLIGDLL
jgi:hypothetical protein